MQERTLSIIKPDAVTRRITGKVNTMIEDRGLKIVAQKLIHLTAAQAKEFYAEHEGKPFFPNLVEIMTSAPVVVQVLQGENAISEYRKIMGATNPAVADEGTIRKTFALSVDKNTVHGSDSAESAKREISFFFSKMEIYE
ncbi:MAG: nucleoside-diphosphate kinase [Alphaproteobacteria bacterium]|nr:nucleoside-diphosphate kinase [Alphaproteobacteria bacterium]